MNAITRWVLVAQEDVQKHVHVSNLQIMFRVYSHRAWLIR